MIADQKTAGRNQAGDAQLNVENSQGSLADVLQPARTRSAVWNPDVCSNERGKPCHCKNDFTRQPECAEGDPEVVTTNGHE